MKEDSEGRVIIDYTTLLPNCAAFSAKVVRQLLSRSALLAISTITHISDSRIE